MGFRTDEIDADTRTYLQRVWRDRGIEGQGVFEKTEERPTWGVWRVVLALAAFGVFAYLSLPGPLSPARLGWQTGLLALGCLMLVSGVHAWRASSRLPWGSFVYADALHLWHVTPTDSSPTRARPRVLRSLAPWARPLSPGWPRPGWPAPPGSFCPW